MAHTIFFAKHLRSASTSLSAEYFVDNINMSKYLHYQEKLSFLWLLLLFKLPKIFCVLFNSYFKLSLV